MEKKAVIGWIKENVEQGNDLALFNSGLLREPGDELVVKITRSGREVMKLKTNGRKTKRSVTRYPNGTIVQTQSKKK